MTPVDSPARIAELIDLYRRTHYGVHDGEDGDVVIRIGQRAPAAVREWIGDDRCAFYISASNPRSVALDFIANMMLTARLRGDLVTCAARFLDGEAGIPGAAWREQGFLVTGIARSAALVLARRYRQNAIVSVPPDGAATLLVEREDWREALAQGPTSAPTTHAVARSK